MLLTSLFTKTKPTCHTWSIFVFSFDSYLLVMKMVGPNLTNEQRRKMVWYLQENKRLKNNNELKRGNIKVSQEAIYVALEKLQPME